MLPQDLHGRLHVLVGALPADEILRHAVGSGDVLEAGLQRPEELRVLGRQAHRLELGLDPHHAPAVRLVHAAEAPGQGLLELLRLILGERGAARRHHQAAHLDALREEVAVGLHRRRGDVRRDPGRGQRREARVLVDRVRVAHPDHLVPLEADRGAPVARLVQEVAHVLGRVRHHAHLVRPRPPDLRRHAATVGPALEEPVAGAPHREAQLRHLDQPGEGPELVDLLRQLEETAAGDFHPRPVGADPVVLQRQRGEQRGPQLGAGVHPVRGRQVVGVDLRREDVRIRAEGHQRRIHDTGAGDEGSRVHRVGETVQVTAQHTHRLHHQRAGQGLCL